VWLVFGSVSLRVSCDSEIFLEVCCGLFYDSVGGVVVLCSSWYCLREYMFFH